MFMTGQKGLTLKSAFIEKPKESIICKALEMYNHLFILHKNMIIIHIQQVRKVKNKTLKYNKCHTLY